MRAEVGVTSWFLPARGIGGVVWAAEAGFGHVHIDMTDNAVSAPSALRSRSQELGITPSGLAVDPLETIGVHGVEAMDAVDTALATASLLDISYVYLPSFGAADIRSPEDLRVTAELLRYTADQGQGRGIVVATENALPAPALVKLFELVDRDNVELLFDTQNLSIRGIDPLEVIELHGTRIRRFAHVKDGGDELGDSRLGAGTCGVDRSIAALLAGGFDGAFVIENDYRAVSGPEVESDIAWLLDTTSDHMQSAPREQR